MFRVAFTRTRTTTTTIHIITTNKLHSTAATTTSTTTNNIMRAAVITKRLLISSLSLLSSWPTTSLVAAVPATQQQVRGATTTTTTTASNEKQAVTDEKGRIVQVLDGTRRNPVVEQFFWETNNDLYDVELRDEIRRQASNLTGFLTQTRRSLHRIPELMYQEEQTSQMLQAVLMDLEIPFSTGWSVNTHTNAYKGPGGYGIVADIGTGGDPCVLLRADMDALPILERTEGVEEFKSQTPNQMHACCHDGHMTMLLGAASILKSMEDSINGTVRLMFQPAEEGGAGGKRMVEEGVLTQEPKVQHAYGMHAWPTLPSGTVGGRPGPLLAATELFEILIAGVGGHAAMPHLTRDPIVAASAIIMNLQTVVSRTSSPLDSSVVSVTKIEAGDAYNVIPASTLLRGTIRALSTENLMALRDRVGEIVETTAKVHGCNVTITYSPDFYPPTVNDPQLYDSFAKHVGALVSEEGTVREVEPTMGGEDFSFVAEKVPSTFFLLGQGSGTNPPTNYGLHHPHFAMDESVLPRGVELHVNLALRSLKKLQQEQKKRLVGEDEANVA